MTKDFYTAVKDRRSIYAIGNLETIPETKLKEVIENALKNSPAAFNCQSTKVVLLLNENHKKLWSIATEALRKVVPADKFAETEEKINSFAAGYGTILYFEDQVVIKGLQEKFALYKDNFPDWSKQGSGIVQYLIWTSLELEGLGVNLQHYNPLIDDSVKSEWSIPESWKLVAQMPFGNIVAKPDDKIFLNTSDFFKICK